eukprot:scaffold38853_cov62-Attheya_sp.AAC.1
MCVCNPASTTDNLCPTVDGGIPTRTGRLRAATLASFLTATVGRLPMLTVVEASRKASAGGEQVGNDDKQHVEFQGEMEQVGNEDDKQLFFDSKWKKGVSSVYAMEDAALSLLQMRVCLVYATHDYE